MEKTLLNTVVVEKLTTLPKEQDIKKHTKWIAKQSTCPIVSTIFGTYINQFCHVLEAYDQKYLISLNQ